jgi:acyl-CoA synthetase (AMP-forming)/AMP-acid ligase II
MSHPVHFNIAETISRRHSDAIYRIAVDERRCGGINTYTFGGLDYLSDKFANSLQKYEVKSGDFVAVLLSPSAAFLVTHFGVLKLGAIVLPIPIQSAKTFLNQVILDNPPKALIIDESSEIHLEGMVKNLSNTQVFVATDIASKNIFENGSKGFWYEINFADADFPIASTGKATIAYHFVEQGENQTLKTTKVNHGDLFAAAAKTIILPNDNPIQTPDDWDLQNVLVERIYPALYLGHRISALDFIGNERRDP